MYLGTKGIVDSFTYVKKYKFKSFFLEYFYFNSGSYTF